MPPKALRTYTKLQTRLSSREIAEFANDYVDLPRLPGLDETKDVLVCCIRHGPTFLDEDKLHALATCCDPWNGTF